MVEIISAGSLRNLETRLAMQIDAALQAWCHVWHHHVARLPSQARSRFCCLADEATERVALARPYPRT